MKKSLVSMLAVAAAFGAVNAAHAQLPTTPFSIEVRGGLALPSGDLADPIDGAETESGVTYGINGQFRASNSLSIYAGFTRSEFTIEDVDDVDLHTQGFNGGVMFRLPMSGLSPYLKGGLVYQHVGFSAEGEDDEDSDDEIGFEVGAGLDFALGNRLSVTPEVSYSTFSPGDDVDIDVAQVKVDVGLKLRI